MMGSSGEAGTVYQYYTENKILSNINLTKSRGLTLTLSNDKQFLLHHCYPSSKSLSMACIDG
jgi:hypothetical protein